MAEENTQPTDQVTDQPTDQVVQEVQKQEINPVFEIDALVKDTYNAIAMWHNDDGSAVGLKQLSLEVVETITKAALQHVGLTADMNVDTTEIKKTKE
jgi:hypothetical protein